MTSLPHSQQASTPFPALERPASVAIYGRVSSDEQREQGTIGVQIDAAKSYCERRDFRLDGLYLDDGVCGTIPLANRPEGARLLADAQAGKFGSVLVYRLDRLSRDALEAQVALKALESFGVTILSVNEQIDRTTSSGRLHANIMVAFGAYDREKILENTAAGTRRKAGEGAWLGGIVPYGYLKTDSRRDPRLMVNDAPIPGYEISEVEVVRTIFRLVADERKSCFQVADYLNALGLPAGSVRDGDEPAPGKRTKGAAGIWTPPRVRNLIKNETYMGIHHHGKRNTRARTTAPAHRLIEREVPAIVPADQWERAQAVLTANKRLAKKNAKRQYLLRGLITCGVCGLTYTGSTFRSSG
jgi:site-specific DNA recombinase